MIRIEELSFMKIKDRLRKTASTTNFGKDKGKIIPLQTWTGPEGSRRLRPQDFKTVGT